MSGTTSTTPSTKTTTATTTTGTTATSTSTTTKVDPKAAAATAALNKAAATTAATKPWNVGHKACLTGETACAAAEAERKVAYELKQKQAKNNKDAKKATTADLACTNDGFVDMIQHATNVSLGILSVVKELATGFVPDNFKRAIEYGWNGLTGAGNWLGYILAAIYYLAEEGGFG